MFHPTLRGLIFLLGLTSAGAAAPLLPLAEGTSWEYRVAGSSLDNEAQPARITVRVEGREARAGRELTRLATFHDDVRTKTELVGAEERGLMRYEQTFQDGRKVEFDPPQTIVPLPLQAGAKWELQATTESGQEAENFVVEKEENVVVPAGTFRAFKMHYEEPWPLSVLVERWFAPGVGWIKDNTITRGPGGRLLTRVTMELTKFNAAPPQGAAAMPATKPSPSPAPSPAETPAPPSITIEPGARSSSPSPTAPAILASLELAGSADGPAATIFAADAPNIYVRWHVENLQSAATARLAWIAEDVGEVVDPNFIVDQIETPLSDPAYTARFTLSRPPDGWAPGTYRVELYLDNVLLRSVTAKIHD